jgi:hypothetical protein
VDSGGLTQDDWRSPGVLDSFARQSKGRLGYKISYSLVGTRGGLEGKETLP